MPDYYDLGRYARDVTTTSAEAQLWFNRGLIWCYGYNHDEAVRCFRKSAECDPRCAMAQWGIAYASGPNYNKQWMAFDVVDLETSLNAAHTATQKALGLLDHASPLEQALIHPLALRYPENNPAKVAPIWNDDYATAMRAVYHSFPDDADVAALFAEAIMNRTPWALWDGKTGKPADGADTAEAIGVLERAMAAEGGMNHPGVLHMYIHLMEMSPTPERALPAADALRNLVPDAGHLIHMPTHIDVLCGHYKAVVDDNARATRADRKYLSREGAINFYSLYRCHNLHFKIYGAMFMGRFAPALEAAIEMAASIPEELLRVKSPPMADWLESFVGMKMHVFIRFGRWEQIIAEPLPADQELFCVTTALLHYAKSVAHAVGFNVSAAEKHAQLFDEARARVPETRYLFNNTALDILAVAAEMMRGEIEYRKMNFAEAFTHLRKSVALYDTMRYDEPWGWMQPARHALGALLLEQKCVEEAAAVYRADLGLDDSLNRSCQHPDNIWSLHGYHECLVKLGRTEEAKFIRQRLDMAVARADVPVKSSCLCRVHQA
jgi:tetratricopeptide (TPR) repeat protein